MEEDAEAIAENWAEVAEEIESYAVKPRRSDVEVQLVALGWAPHWEIAHRSARGKLTHDRVPAWG
jgi:hypothetical protein